MAQIVNFIYDEKVLPGTLLEIHIQSFFDGIQKAGGDIMSCLLMTMNVLPSTDYVWNLLQRVAIFIPFIIYSQYEYYKLTNRIYNLTWVLTYEMRRKNMFTIAPQPANNVSTQVFERTSCTSNKETDRGDLQVRDTGTSGQSSSCVSGSASAHACSDGWNTLEMCDMRRPCDGYGIPKVKSTPSMFCGRTPNLISVFTFSPLERGIADKLTRNRLIWPSHSSLRQDEIEGMKLIAFNASIRAPMISELTQDCIPASKAKKIKNDHGYCGRLRGSVVMNVFPKPDPQKQVVEYRHLPENRSSYKSWSERSSSKSIITQRSHVRFPSNLMTRNTIGKRYESPAKTNKTVTNFRPETECDRKWRNIFERTEALKSQRISRLREMEMRKMQEKEKRRKIEIMKRRAIRAKIREDNKRILMKDEARKPSVGKSNEICLDPVVIENNSPSSLNLEGYGDGGFCWNPSAQVPVLRVTKRTFRIEHTSKRIGKNNGSDIEYSSNRTFSRTDKTFNVLEASDKIVNQHSEFFLVPTEKAECADPKGFVYIEMRSNNPLQRHSRESLSGDTVTNKSENVGSYRTELETIDPKENTNASYLLSRQSCDKDSEVFESVVQHDFPGQILQVKNLASEFEKLAAAREVPVKIEGPSTKLQGFENPTLSRIVNVEVKETIPTEDSFDTSSVCESKAGRSVIRKVKRRLTKTPNIKDATITENATVDVACIKEPTKLEGCSLTNDIPDPSCTLDAKGIYLSSLELKKLEVRKRLKDRLREQCETPVEQETLGTVKTSEKQSKQKETRPISAKNVKTVLAKRSVVGGIKFSSKSTISLRDLPSQKRSSCKKLGRPLLHRVYTRNSPSVSSLILSDNDPNGGCGNAETGRCREDKRSKIFEHFGDSKKRISTGSRKKRHPRRKKLSQLLDSFKSEIKDVITATASSLSSRLIETPHREIGEGRSADATEDLLKNSSQILYVTHERKSNDSQSGGDADSRSSIVNVENTKEMVPEETKRIGRKKDTSQASNLRANASIYG